MSVVLQNLVNRPVNHTFVEFVRQLGAQSAVHAHVKLIWIHVAHGAI